MKNEKKKKAVAIKYDTTMVSPKIVAKGVGKVAENILKQENNIPVVENKELVEELSKVDIGENIPPELYEVVAKVLVFISDLDEKEQFKNAKHRK